MAEWVIQSEGVVMSLWSGLFMEGKPTKHIYRGPFDVKKSISKVNRKSFTYAFEYITYA